ncbi:hypothetical protein D1007_31383 [Hordeum vulgare]|nr:hypothetical protein D1007_31383 [Hordeum vulgare]
MAYTTATVTEPVRSLVVTGSGLVDRASRLISPPSARTPWPLPLSPSIIARRHHYRRAMVYEDESRNDMSNLDINSSSDGMQYRIPASIEDEDYMGIEISALDVCSEHRLPPECRQPQNCSFLGWVDPEWPPTMQNALLKLWEMLEDNKSARRDNNLESSLKIHQLTEEKRNLNANYDKLIEDVNQLLNAQEQRVMDLSYLQDKVNAHGAERSSVVVVVMKTEIDKKEADKMELQGKYSVLMNLVEAQGRVIRNQKANH